MPTSQTAKQRAALSTALGFRWDTPKPPQATTPLSTARVCFHLHRMLPEYVQTACELAGSPLPFVDVKTITDSTPMRQRPTPAQASAIRITNAYRYLLERVKANAFAIDAANFAALNQHIVGHHTTSTPAHGLPAADATSALGHQAPYLQGPGLEANIALIVEHVGNPHERAAVLFAFMTAQPLAVDQQILTAFVMMNGILLTSGIDALSLSSAKTRALMEQIDRFQATGDATGVIALLVNAQELDQET